MFPYREGRRSMGDPNCAIARAGDFSHATATVKVELRRNLCITQITPNPIAREVDKLLEHREHGFFVECGAYNGVSGSNTLFFETRRNWSGLLVEANERLFKQLLALNRKVCVV